MSGCYQTLSSAKLSNVSNVTIKGRYLSAGSGSVSGLVSSCDCLEFVVRNATPQFTPTAERFFITRTFCEAPTSGKHSAFVVCSAQHMLR